MLRRLNHRLEALEAERPGVPQLIVTDATISQARAELADWRTAQAAHVDEPVDLDAVATVVERRLLALAGAHRGD